MTGVDGEPCRIRDVVRNSKIHWDISLKVNQEVGSFTSELIYSKDENECHKKECYLSQYIVSRIRMKIRFFNGAPDRLIDWANTVEDFFVQMDIPEQLKCEIASYAMEGEAEHWWQQLQHGRLGVDKSEVYIWKEMKYLLFNNFLPTSCSRKINGLKEDNMGKMVGGLCHTEASKKDGECSEEETKCSERAEVIKLTRQVGAEMREFLHADGSTPAKCSMKVANESNSDKHNGISNSELLYAAGENAFKQYDCLIKSPVDVYSYKHNESFGSESTEHDVEGMKELAEDLKGDVVDSKQVDYMLLKPPSQINHAAILAINGIVLQDFVNDKQKDQREVKGLVSVVRFGTTVSLMLDGTISFMSLICGKYLAFVYLVVNYAPLLFDPGGTLYPVRTRSISLMNKVLKDTVTLRNAWAMLEKCVWSFDRVVENRVGNRDLLSLCGPLDSVVRVMWINSEFCGSCWIKLMKCVIERNDIKVEHEAPNTIKVVNDFCQVGNGTVAFKGKMNVDTYDVDCVVNETRLHNFDPGGISVETVIVEVHWNELNMLSYIFVTNSKESAYKLLWLPHSKDMQLQAMQRKGITNPTETFVPLFNLEVAIEMLTLKLVSELVVWPCLRVAKPMFRFVPTIVDAYQTPFIKAYLHGFLSKCVELFLSTYLSVKAPNHDPSRLQPSPFFMLHTYAEFVYSIVEYHLVDLSQKSRDRRKVIIKKSRWHLEFSEKQKSYNTCAKVNHERELFDLHSLKEMLYQSSLLKRIFGGVSPTSCEAEKLTWLRIYTFTIIFTPDKNARTDSAQEVSNTPSFPGQIGNTPYFPKYSMISNQQKPSFCFASDSLDGASFVANNLLPLLLGGCCKRGNDMAEVLKDLYQLIITLHDGWAESTMKHTMVVIDISNMPEAAKKPSICIWATTVEFDKDVMGLRPYVVASRVAKMLIFNFDTGGTPYLLGSLLQQDRFLKLKPSSLKKNVNQLGLQAHCILINYSSTLNTHTRFYGINSTAGMDCGAELLCFWTMVIFKRSVKTVAGPRSKGVGNIHLFNSSWDVYFESMNQIAYITMVSQHQIWIHNTNSGVTSNFRRDDGQLYIADASMLKNNNQMDTGLALTRGRVIQWERWNDKNNAYKEMKLDMVESGPCVTLCKNGQSRESLKLFYKLVNGLDPPVVYFVGKLEDEFIFSGRDGDDAVRCVVLVYLLEIYIYLVFMLERAILGFYVILNWGIYR